jgi:hypothetical protein
MLVCPSAIINETLAHLQAGGVQNCETTVLWLGRRSGDDEAIVEAFRPQQIVDSDFFRIPAEGMRSLIAHLRGKRLHILAQVHSHPELAFHSRADDEWAIVRHQGAVSLVIPRFGLRTTSDSFLRDVVAFQLDATDHWSQVAPNSVLTIHP